MINSETSAVFFGISMLLGFTPGPDNIYVLLQSAKYGKRTGLFILLGLCTGLVVHTCAVALGLSVLIVKSNYALSGLKYIGTAYLVYLAWQIAFAPNSDFNAIDVRPAGSMAPYIKGLALNLSNPKVILFFIAFLPQFIGKNSTSVTFDLISLGLIFIIATLISFGSIIFFSDYLRRYISQHPKLERIMNGLACLIFIGLAVHLAILAPPI